MLQSLTIQHKRRNAEDDRRIHSPKAIFRLVFALVDANVTIAEPVIEPVAPEKAEDGPDHGSEPEPGELEVGEEVRAADDELRDGAADPDGPHEDDHGVDGGY